MKTFYLLTFLLAFAVVFFSFKKGNEKPGGAGVLINGVVWAECNVDKSGAFAAEPESYGRYFQWNRKTGWSNTDDVSGWDKSMPTGESWTESNDPCPAGWRVPTKEEYGTLGDAARVANMMTTQNGVVGCRFTDKKNSASIFFPAAGALRHIDGTSNGQGIRGNYWSVTKNESNTARHLRFSDELVSPASSSYCNYGFSVRCVR